MNLDAYISSGILEAYLLGELTELERLEVERHLAEHPELQRELIAIEEAMEVLISKGARTPRPNVKQQLLAKASASRTPQASHASKPAGKTILFWQYATAAAVVLAFTSAWMAYTYRNNWKQSELSLNELRAFNTQVAQDYNQVNQRLDAMETEMKVMNNPNFTRVMLKGTSHAPDAMASVYWNPSSEEVFLSVLNLKPLSSDQQYQLWAIVDGKPVDMGVFDSPQNGSTLAGLVKMKQAGRANAFAVTIEPRGGKESPSMETMQVLGSA